jgi:IS30 family transposase
MAQHPYRQLSEEERRLLSHHHQDGMSISLIAKVLNRHRSTIYREFQRNEHHNGHHAYYTPSKAQEKAMGRRSKPRRHSHFSDTAWRLVEQYIRINWSPEQVANSIFKSHQIAICHETIYRHIYNEKKNGGNLYMHLRHRSRKRRKRYRSKDSRGRLAGKRMITERPESINLRQSIGHWEIDTVWGKGSKHCIVTMVERKTGYLSIGLLKNKTSEELNRVVIKLIKGMSMPVLTITSDNGSEFHGYKEIEDRTGTTFYFALPHHAWERGTNENTNGLIRQYLPKGQSMKWIKQSTCNHIAKMINERPRKRLNYNSPNEHIKRIA